MTPSRYLTWDNFLTTVFVPGEKRVHRVADLPRIEIFGDGVANRIGILLEIPSISTLPGSFANLEFIQTRMFSESGSAFLEVTTSSTNLHRQFYHFAVAVAERVLVESRPAVEAVDLELEAFAELLDARALLTTERQIGLIGELMFLHLLVLRTGVGALEAWIGPLGEPHDFRIQHNEFEVKTTLSPQRIHTIHGTEQLVATAKCSLYLVSVLLGPAGAEEGFTLSDKIAELERQFEPSPDRTIRFAAALDSCGFHAADRAHYHRRFTIRRPIALVPVTDAFPLITRPVIQKALGALAIRIEGVQYDVNIDGLEREEGTREFDSALPL